MTTNNNIMYMEILKHFQNKTDKDFVILALKDEEWEDFFNKLPDEFKDCFISEDDLKTRVKILSSTEKKELSEILPNEGNIMSGDFGEILAYHIFKELNKGVDGPKKWRWKESQNVAAPYSDVILYSIDNKKYSNKDLLISAESKMKASKRKYSQAFLDDDKKHVRIQEAINGAQKDYISRIAYSLGWIRKKYKDELLKATTQKSKYLELIKSIDRFFNSEKDEFGPYIKKVKAIALVDKDMLDYEIQQEIVLPKIPDMDLEVYIVAIKDLQAMYEKLYSTILK